MLSKRREDLNDLQSFLSSCDKEVTMILQSLQWDRNNLNTDQVMKTCMHNDGHRLPANKKREHESKCCLKIQGYGEEDVMFQEPFDCNADTVVKLSTNKIKNIIEEAAKTEPNFRKGNGWDGPPPLTLDRLQSIYTSDERRAIYDAVVAAVPTCHNLADLALQGTDALTTGAKTKSRLEILSELRDMRRRRTKYRVAAKTKNYSDVLREVITTQMEFYTDTQDQRKPQNYGIKEMQHFKNIKREKSLSEDKCLEKDDRKIDKEFNSSDEYQWRHARQGKDVRKKQTDYNYGYSCRYQENLTERYSKTTKTNSKEYQGRKNYKSSYYDCNNQEKRETEKYDTYKRDTSRNERRDRHQHEKPKSGESYRKYDIDHRADKYSNRSKSYYRKEQKDQDPNTKRISVKKCESSEHGLRGTGQKGQTKLHTPDFANGQVAPQCGRGSVDD
ncbi:unnamed protein product [Leptosia nina]|uniref:CHHC U11-48K-type domain-containing protein n=1 Tax=Leptosia nina TaxID=320188 RepID=A0AAV1JT63_9NEOP